MREGESVLIGSDAPICDRDDAFSLEVEAWIAKLRIARARIERQLLAAFIQRLQRGSAGDKRVTSPPKESLRVSLCGQALNVQGSRNDNPIAGRRSNAR
jgi:hypothetical protein